MLRNILVVAILVVSGAFLYFSYTKPEMLPAPLQTYAPQIKNTIDSGTTQLTTVFNKNKETGPAIMGITSEASKVFQEDTSEKPIHQKAMDFAQYQYCAQVVKDYEKQHLDLSTPSASPTPDEKDEE